MVVNPALSPCGHQEELDHIRHTMGEELRHQQESIYCAQETMSQVRTSLYGSCLSVVPPLFEEPLLPPFSNSLDFGTQVYFSSITLYSEYI